MKTKPANRFSKFFYIAEVLVVIVGLLIVTLLFDFRFSLQEKINKDTKVKIELISRDIEEVKNILRIGTADRFSGSMMERYNRNLFVFLTNSVTELKDKDYDDDFISVSAIKTSVYLPK